MIVDSSRRGVVGICLAGTRRAGLGQRQPARRCGHSGSVAQSRSSHPGVCLRTAPAPADTAASAAHRRLDRHAEALRRDRLPLAAMSEGARQEETLAPPSLRPSDQRRPDSPCERTGRSVPTREADPSQGVSNSPPEVLPPLSIRVLQATSVLTQKFVDKVAPSPGRLPSRHAPARPPRARTGPSLVARSQSR